MVRTRRLPEAMTTTLYRPYTNDTMTIERVEGGYETTIHYADGAADLPGVEIHPNRRTAIEFGAFLGFTPGVAGTMASAFYLHADNGTVHMVDSASPWRFEHTLCGRTVRKATVGDETVSGLAATCGSCKRVAKSRWSR